MMKKHRGKKTDKNQMVSHMSISNKRCFRRKQVRMPVV